MQKSDSKITSERTSPLTEKKDKRKKKTTNDAVKFPFESRINAYGFIHLKVRLLAALGWRVDMPIKIERNVDGSITVRKA